MNECPCGNFCVQGDSPAVTAATTTSGVDLSGSLVLRWDPAAAGNIPQVRLTEPRWPAHSPNAVVLY